MRKELKKKRRVSVTSLFITTSELNIPDSTLLKIYRGKNAIEHAFRTLKSVLHISPVYVYRADHIVSLDIYMIPELSDLLKALLEAYDIKLNSRFMSRKTNGDNTPLMPISII